MNGPRVHPPTQPHQIHRPHKPPNLPRHMSWTAGKGSTANKETILEKIGLMRSKSPSNKSRNQSFVSQQGQQQPSNGFSNGNGFRRHPSMSKNASVPSFPTVMAASNNKPRMVMYENTEAVKLMSRVPPPIPRLPFARAQFPSANFRATFVSGPRTRQPDSKLPPLPPGVRPRSPTGFGRVNGILLNPPQKSSANPVMDSDSVLSWGSSWSDGSSFSGSAPDSLMGDNAVIPHCEYYEEEVYVDCTSSVIYLGNYRGSSGSEFDAYSSYYSSGSCKYSCSPTTATPTGNGKSSNRRNKKRKIVAFALLRVLYFHESCDREDQEISLSFGEEGGEEASDEESSTEEADHTYESLYDVIGGSGSSSANRSERTSLLQPHPPTTTNSVGGHHQQSSSSAAVEGDDASFDDDLFDDSFDSASDDDDGEKGGTLTKGAEGLSEVDLVSEDSPERRASKTISAGQKIRKKLRRNWSLTKSDIREGINRIRKKSSPGGPISSFTSLLPVGTSGGVPGAEIDYSGPGQQHQPVDQVHNQPYNRSRSTGPVVAVPAKKTNWSLKSHFKKKSMSASSLKPGSPGGGGERKESSMFYLTLTIKSDEKPDSVLRRLENSDFAISTHHAHVHGHGHGNGQGQGHNGAPGSCPCPASSAERPGERPRRRRSDADSESARSNSSGGHDGNYRIQSPSGESNSSSSYGSTSLALGSRPSGKGRPPRPAGQSIARPKIAPPDPPKGASPRRTSGNSCATGSMVELPGSSSSAANQRPLPPVGGQQDTPAKRRHSSSAAESNKCVVSDKKCHRLSAVDPPTTASTSSVRFQEPGKNQAPPTRTASTSSSGSSASSGSSGGRSFSRAMSSELPTEPPPLPPVPPSLRAAMSSSSKSLGATSSSGGEKRGEPAQESHYTNPSSLFACFDEDSYVSSQLADEPLYQFYTATVLERATQYQGQTSCGEDDYEVIGEDDANAKGHHHQHSRPSSGTSKDASDGGQPGQVVVRIREKGQGHGQGHGQGQGQGQRSRPASCVSSGDGDDKDRKRMSALEALELAGPRSPHRTLWCELPQVKDSGVLETMSVQEKKLQEAIFEVITSEASYLKSLNILVRHFMQCPKFSDDSHPDCVLSRRDRDVLFSDILPVRDVSEALLCDLEKRWAEHIVIGDISDIILAHAQDHFGVYVKYCSNKIHQDRLLNNLKETSPQFCEVLRELESDPVCQSLSMHSFLMLPMQRITRLPLLIDAIFHRHPPSSVEYENCKNALTVLNKVVHECNEGARKMERLEELLVLSRQLDFGAGVKALPLMSASRWLVKRGQLTRLLWKESDTMKRAGGLGRSRPHKQPLHLFLFTDVLIITKRKGSEEQGFTVLDYCSRNMIQIQDDLEEGLLPGKLPDGVNKAHVMLVTLLENREGKTVEMVLACPGDSERARWVEAVTPRRSNDPNEVIYEEWDCPQVQAIHPYTAEQPDELSLETSDVVNVFKKTVDGWYQGERIRDGERGWFPGNFCEEIASAHVRARNLRQRYRLLVLSGSYLEEKRRISTVGKAATFYVPSVPTDKRRERKTASSVFAPP